MNDRHLRGDCEVTTVLRGEIGVHGKRTIGGLVVATAVLWTVTLLLTDTEPTAYHRLLIGGSSAMLAITGMVIYIEHNRAVLVEQIVDRLGRRFTSLDEVLNYGIAIGREEERAEHVTAPVLLDDYRTPASENGARPAAVAAIPVTQR